MYCSRYSKLAAILLNYLDYFKITASKQNTKLK